MKSTQYRPSRLGTAVTNVFPISTGGSSNSPQRIETSGSYATDDKGTATVAYVWDHSLGEIINALIAAGLTIEFLHEFPFAARAKFPFMQQGEDGWWRLPPEQHGIIPFLFSLQACK